MATSPLPRRKTLNLANTTTTAVGISLTGSIGASGSNIAINSNGAGTGGLSIAGNLGSAVTSVTQASAGSTTLAGNNSAFYWQCHHNFGHVEDGQHDRAEQ